eukprot:scaffold221701_cov30-Tisochrysis_lutea.AAC.4
MVVEQNFTTDKLVSGCGSYVTSSRARFENRVAGRDKLARPLAGHPTRWVETAHMQDGKGSIVSPGAM